MVGNPSLGDYINMVWYAMIQSCPVTPKAVINANTFLGPDVAYLKGKNTRKSSDMVVTEYVDTPPGNLVSKQECNPGCGRHICELVRFLCLYIVVYKFYHA